MIRCEYKHLSSGPVSSEDWWGSNARATRTDASSQLLASCSFCSKSPPHFATTILRPVSLETLEKPPICLRLVRVNRINPCPSRFKAESAGQRITLRLPSSVRQLGRSALTTQPPPLLGGKFKRPLHVWIFIRANETLRKLAE